MFRFAMHGRDCSPRGGGRGREFDPERFLHWVERMGGGGGRPGRGGGRRMFDGGELRLVLLRLIADAPRHGYDLIRAIEALTGGGYAPSPGVVYPTLTLLGEMGLIAEATSEGAKKRYAVTAEGEAYLAERAEEVAALIARLKAVGEQRGRADHAPVRRAMGGLREAVRGRLIRGEGDELPHDIAAILDEAAQRIERLR